MGILTDLTDGIGLTDSGAVDEAMGKAAGYSKEQLERLNDIDIPDIEKQKILLENPELVGLLEAEQLGASSLDEISLDPKAREAQLAALESLRGYSEEGVTDTDKYAMEQMLGQVGASTKSNQANIEADMARRGMDSSGAALMSQMNAQQTGANNARQQAMQQAASGQQNRMAALGQLATQSGNMQNADYSRQANAASAKDAIAQANAANRYQTNAANLGARQAIENQRANISNQNQAYNKGLEQQQFNNELSKAGAQNQASGNLANMYSQQGQAKAAADAATVGAVAGIGSSFIGAEDGGVISNYHNGGVHDNFQDGIDSRRKEAAEKEEKQHDAFKKKYMKKVHNELMDGDRRDIPSASLHAKDGGCASKKYENGGTMYASDGMGDIVDSGMESYAGDRVDAKINDGEMILNVPQQQRLMDIIKGEESVDNMGESDIVEGVPRDYRDSLHEEKSEGSLGGTKLRGLEQLLKMLGEQ
jgi:hypothetical protein